MPARERLARHPDLPLRAPSVAGQLSFDGRPIPFCEGDTIASALCASGVSVFSRSFKYHRPRGIYDAHGFGSEVLVSIDGAPNLLADRVLAEAGMDVRTQNAWPSVGFDLMAVNDKVVPLLPNAFYYKIFHKPKWLWPLVEKRVRAAAGLGRIDVSGRDAGRRYEKRYRFPDVCVIGAGPAGLSAALAAAAAGAQVLLIERFANLGGHAVHDATTARECRDASLDGLPAHAAVAKLIAAVEENPDIEVLTGTSVFGVYEDNQVAAERGTDLFKIRAKGLVVASGASDRHLVFDHNDIPGIMTGRAAERLIAVHAIAPGRRAAVVTNHDGGYHTAKLLAGAGVEVAAVVDAREGPCDGEFEGAVAGLGIRIVRGETISAARGRKRVESVTIAAVGGDAGETIGCDVVAVAVGFTPQLGLLSMGRSRPRWDSEREIFRVPELPRGLYAAGEVNGTAQFGRLCREGWEIGEAAADGAPAPESVRRAEENIAALPPDVGGGGSKRFVCKCMDVTRKEIQASIAEGFDQIETLKRLTSMGMGRCQGKTCYEAGARIAAIDGPGEAADAAPSKVRPPFAPVSLGVLAGRAPHLVPVRRTPMHDCHVRAGASFLAAGQWKRPETYTSTHTEAMAVREGLGIIDVSTLGKLEISGPDVLDLLHFMLPGRFAKLAVGRVRYHTMNGEDGVVYEDGTIAHVEPGRYFISCTTGNADAIRHNFWWWTTTEGFDVRLVNLGPALAAVNVTGPRAREFVREIVDIDVSNEAFPYMAVRFAHIEGVRVYLFRIGFTGELAYEIHFPAEYGESLWAYLMEKGRPYGIEPFGVETQRVLRLEKGHILPGVDTDALTSPYEAGVGFTIKDDKPDFLGKAFLAQMRERGPRDALIAYRLGPGDPIPDDGVVILDAGRVIGRVTSARMSPVLGHGIGLGWVERDHAGPGTEIEIRLADGRSVSGEVLADHAAYDPEGAKLRS
jgi:sarcosine oxidase subunit alpha